MHSLRLPLDQCKSVPGVAPKEGKEGVENTIHIVQALAHCQQKSIEAFVGHALLTPEDSLDLRELDGAAPAQAD